MLTKDQKKQLVKDLSEKIKASKSAVFVDYKGLKVKDLSELKKELKKNKVHLKVVKKTLIKRALKDSGIEMDVKGLEGQVAIAISEDEIAGAKIIDKFGKTNENIKILAGILQKKLMTSAEVKALAKLPGKEEMLAKLVSTINAPVSGFVNVLAGNIRGLVQVLKAVSEKK
ncbi:MAG: 50S ribosomal protein L10 [Candidatus Moranbacteria bacterium]|nr:50S ribosomal protein L10 [Candidatus Moranbacteria bacterium]